MHLFEPIYYMSGSLLLRGIKRTFRRRRFVCIREFVHRWRAQLNCAGAAVRGNVINESPPTKYLERQACGFVESELQYCWNCLHMTKLNLSIFKRWRNQVNNLVFNFKMIIFIDSFIVCKLKCCDGRRNAINELFGPNV